MAPFPFKYHLIFPRPRLLICLHFPLLEDEVTTTPSSQFHRQGFKEPICLIQKPHMILHRKQWHWSLCRHPLTDSFNVKLGFTGCPEIDPVNFHILTSSILTRLVAPCKLHEGLRRRAEAVWWPSLVTATAFPKSSPECWIALNQTPRAPRPRAPAPLHSLGWDQAGETPPLPASLAGTYLCCSLHSTKLVDKYYCDS